MAYIALRKMIVAGGRAVVPGELVPEANDWSNVGVWEQAGHILHVPDRDVDELLSKLRRGEKVGHIVPPSNPYVAGLAVALRRQNPGAVATSPATAPGSDGEGDDQTGDDAPDTGQPGEPADDSPRRRRRARGRG